MDSTSTRTAVLNTALLKARLATIKSAGSSSSDKEVDVNICVICLEQVTEKAHARPCQHSQFDFICLASWLQERSSCPLCNTEVTAIHYGFDKDGGHKEYAIKSTSRSASQTPSQAPSQPRTPTSHVQPRRPYMQRPAMQPDSAVERRRRIYRENLYSMHMGSNHISGYRDFTPQTFTQSPDLQARARKWIRRELRVFEYLYPASTTSASTTISPSSDRPIPAKPDRRANNAEFLLEYIIAILKTVDIQGPTGQTIEMLKEFLGRGHATLFLHELRQWLRSPYAKVEEWDGNVQYAVSGKEMAGYKEGARPGKGGEVENVDEGGRKGDQRYSPYWHSSQTRRGEAPD